MSRNRLKFGVRTMTAGAVLAVVPGMAGNVGGVARRSVR
jgi:hypothetical protein